MPMTLAQIDAKLKEVETHNATLTTRKQVWAEGVKKEFGVETSAELKAMLADVERQLAEKNKEYDAAVAEAERLLKAAMNPPAPTLSPVKPSAEFLRKSAELKKTPEGAAMLGK